MTCTKLALLVDDIVIDMLCRDNKAEAYRGHRPSLPPLWTAIFRVSSLILQGSVSSGLFSLGLVYTVGVGTLFHWRENKPASTSTTKGSVAPTQHSRE
jgi:hypothetical protein